MKIIGCNNKDKKVGDRVELLLPDIVCGRCGWRWDFFGKATYQGHISPHEGQVLDLYSWFPPIICPKCQTEIKNTATPCCDYVLDLEVYA